MKQANTSFLGSFFEKKIKTDLSEFLNSHIDTLEDFHICAGKKTLAMRYRFI